MVEFSEQKDGCGGRTAALGRRAKIGSVLLHQEEEEEQVEEREREMGKIEA